jgi:hypothetical protein
MSTPVVMIGWIILTPCIIGMLISGLLFLDTADNPFGWIFSLPLVIAFFVAGLIGWLLVMKKHVLQCQTCGTLTDAAPLPWMRGRISGMSGTNRGLLILLVLFGLTRFILYLNFEVQPHISESTPAVVRHPSLTEQQYGTTSPGIPPSDSPKPKAKPVPVYGYHCPETNTPTQERQELRQFILEFVRWFPKAALGDVVSFRHHFLVQMDCTQALANVDQPSVPGSPSPLVLKPGATNLDALVEAMARMEQEGK